MLTKTEASIEMQRYLNNAISFMKKKGYILPTIIVINKGEPIDVEVSHKAVLEVATNIEEDDFTSPNEDELYQYGISFKLNKNYKDEYLEEVARKIAEEDGPDAIGAISACLIRDFGENELPQEMNIQKDPEAVRVLFMVYYMKGDPKPNYMVVPYTKEEVEDPGWGEDAYLINTIASSWNTGVDEEDLIMPNPYN
jgi:hypothetical protein